ncbi:hypothetical protein THTE_2505 [Thermogutta terrifontis]|uniref:Uncharacterized protein n=1 Tax=Thermogutta terrifontis TaxID=1331910 RepID=A0A286RGN4_9BACT|nr:hypothetical protein THTE_2505 [Thermogutta terrifontis]
MGPIESTMVVRDDLRGFPYWIPFSVLRDRREMLEVLENDPT